MSFNLHLPSIRKPFAGLIQAVSVLALFCAIAAPAQAQTRPRIPTLTCGSHPAIINTAIDGSTGYNNASSPIAVGAPDEHWDWANSTIQYPTNVGLNYPKSNPVPGNTATDQPAATTDSIGVGGMLIKNPETDIDPTKWSTPPRYTNVSWQPSPFNNAQWIGGASLPRGTTFLRYQFDIATQADADNFRWSFDYMTDDNIRQVFVNGVRQLAPTADTPTVESVANSYGGGFSNISAMSLRNNWKQGRNVVIFALWNYGPSANTFSPSGLLIQASGASFCGSDLQVNKYVQQGAGFSTTSLRPFTGTVAANATVYYNITVSNQSSNALSGVVLNDPIPTGLSTATGFSWQCQVLTPSPVACSPATFTGTSLNLPTIPAKGSLMLVLTARTAAAPLEPVITNVVTVVPPTGSPSGICTNADGTNGCTSSASVSTGAYVSIKKSLPLNQPGPFYAGDQVKYLLNVVNEGSVDVTGVTLSDKLPADLSNGQWTCTVPADSFATCPATSSGTIDTNGNFVGLTGGFPIRGQSNLLFTVTGTVGAVAQTKVVPNTASITAAGGGAQCWNGSTANPKSNVLPCNSTANVTLLPPTPVALGKTQAKSGLLYVGDTQSYSVTVTNNGTVATTGTLADALPAGMTLVDQSCAITPATTPPTPACSLNTAVTLPAGSTLTYTLNTTVGPLSAPTQPIVNQATWTPSVPAHTVCTATPQAAGLTTCTAEVSNTGSIKPILDITAEVVPNTNVPLGAAVTYAVTATNTSTVNAPNVNVQAGSPSPAGSVTFTGDWTCDAALSSPGVCNGYVAASGDLNATLGSLPAGQKAVFTRTGLVSAALAQGAPVVLTAMDTTNPLVHTCYESAEAQANGSCQTTAVFTVSKPALSITNNVAPNANVNPGQTVSYTVVVTNTGGVGLADAKVDIGAVSGITPVSITSCAASPAPAACPVFGAAAGGTIASSSTGVLPVGASYTIVVSAKVDTTAPFSTTLSMPAKVSTAAPGLACTVGTPVGTNACQANAPLTTSAAPVLSISNSVNPTTAAPNGDVTFTIIAKNESGSPISDGAVTTDTPANITLGAWTCQAAGSAVCPAPGGSGALAQTGANMPVGGTLTYVLAGKLASTVTDGSTITLNANIASAVTGNNCPAGTATAPCTAPATVSVNFVPPVLSITNMATPTTAAPDQNVSFKIVVTNTLGKKLTDGVVNIGTTSTNIDLGAWTCVASTGSTCPAAGGTGALPVQNGATIELNGTLTYTLNGKVKTGTADGTAIVMDASVNSATTGVTCAGGTSPACKAPSTVTVTFVPPVLSITNSVAPTTALPGDEVTFSIVAKNTLGKALTDGVVNIKTASTNIDLGTWTCVASAGSTCPAASGTGAMPAQSGATIELNGTLTYTLKGKIKTGTADGTAITMDASIDSVTPGVTCVGGTAPACKAPSTVTVKLNPAVLQLGNVANPSTVAPGGKSTFTIVATNNTGAPITDGVLSTDSPANLTIGNWTCTASGGAVCPQSASLTKASGPLNLTGLNLPVGASLTYTAEGTLASTLKDGDSVTLTATLNSATAGVTCVSGALPCVQPATVKIKAAVVGEVTPVPVDSIWMLAALASLMLAAAAVMQQRMQRAEKAQRK